NEDRAEASSSTSGERKPVLTRHHQLEQNEIYRLARKHGAHASAVRSVAHLEALLDEITPQHGPYAGLVIDDQDMERISHSKGRDRALLGGKASSLKLSQCATFSLLRISKATASGINR